MFLASSFHDSEDCRLMIPEHEPFPPCSLSYFLPLPLSAVVDATQGSISTKRSTKGFPSCGIDTGFSPGETFPFWFPIPELD